MSTIISPGPAAVRSASRKARANDPGPGVQLPHGVTGEPTRSAWMPARANPPPSLWTNFTQPHTNPGGKGASGRRASLAVAGGQSRPAPGPVAGCRPNAVSTRPSSNRPIRRLCRRRLLACTTPIDQTSIPRCGTNEPAGALAGLGTGVVMDVGDASPAGLTGRGAPSSSRRPEHTGQGCQSASKRSSPVSQIPLPAYPCQRKHPWFGPDR